MEEQIKQEIPISLRIEAFKRGIESVIQSSELPISVVTVLWSDYTRQIEMLAKEQLEKDIEIYNNMIEESTKEETQEDVSENE